jgi:hypothetical protein
MQPLNLHRTGVTSLTDAELIILDIAALRIASRQQYRDETFVEMWDYPSHGLDDETLGQTLDRFTVQGIMTDEPFFNRYYRRRDDPTIRLTELGGAFWESERRPNWMRYIHDFRPFNLISIFGYSAEMCQRYFDVVRESNLINYDSGTVMKAVGMRRLIYWRVPQPVHILCALIVNGSGRGIPSWSYFKSQRVWWRFPNELITVPLEETRQLFG